MMTPQGFERMVELRQQQLWQEAALERLAREASARSGAPSLRRWLAGSLYHLAAWLSTGVGDAMADARSSGATIRAVADCYGVEYWRPTTMPLRR